jgi:coenzyme F420-0:L-glutamate ligase/coenzyme F420-1:gamma-L-glutamate ligase
MTATDLFLRPLLGVPKVVAGDDPVAIALAALKNANEALRDGDVLVFAQKIISKAEGRSVDLADISPSASALSLAGETGKDPRLVELILQESSEVVRYRPGLLIVVHRLGFVLANAGIDRSSVDVDGRVLLLPLDPDASAALIRSKLRAKAGVDIGVLIIDSLGRAWRMGTIGTAIGISGLPGLIDMRGRPDLCGRPLESTEIGFADELAAAASLMMGQADEGTPIVLARGVPYGRRDGTMRELLRPKERDLFR